MNGGTFPFPSEEPGAGHGGLGAWSPQGGGTNTGRGLPSGALRVGTARGRRAERATTAHFRVRPRGVGRLRRGPGGRRSVGGGRSASPGWRPRTPGGWRGSGPEALGASGGRPGRSDATAPAPTEMGLAGQEDPARAYDPPPTSLLARSPRPVLSGWVQDPEPFEVCSSEWSPRSADPPPLRLSESCRGRFGAEGLHTTGGLRACTRATPSPGPALGS